MAYVPPPRALTPEEFKRRWDSGERTMREIDPSLAKWVEQNSRQHRLNLLLLCVGSLFLVGTLGVLVFLGVFS